MPAAANHESGYLQETVGEALARGCAAVISAQPNDPVEYLGQWLLRFVKNAEIEGQFYEEKRNELEAKKQALEAQQAAAAAAKEREEERKLVISELSQLVAEPRVLLQSAVDLIKKYTAAGAAYAASVAEPEEPDWVEPEDPEDPAAMESEDDPDPGPPGEEEDEQAAAAATKEETATEEEGEGGEAIEQGAADGSASGPKIMPRVDYSKKYLSYVVATAGQEFVPSTELHRPGPPPENADDDFKPELPAFTFRILDERMPMVYTPNVAFEPSIKFFKGFPKIGAYQACGVQTSDSTFKAVIAADTLFPEAGGQALSQEDQDFIWEVSLALSKAYEANEKKTAEEQEGKSAAELLAALKTRIIDIHHPPPPPEGEEADPPAPQPAVPEEPEEAGEGEQEEGEGEGAAADGEAGPDPIAVLKAEIKELTASLAASEDAQTNAGKQLETSQKVLEAVIETIVAIQDEVIATWKHTSVVPQATYHALKAVLYLLGKPYETFKNWKRAFVYFTPELFQELSVFDATADRDMAAWKKVRSAYKGIHDMKKLETEMPDTFIGILLLQYIKAVRKVARRAATFRAELDNTNKLAEQLDEKKAALVEAKRIRAEEEEAARKAAEEEAARLAAEGAQEGGEEEAAEEDQ